jgi:hypothetical protein
MTLGDAFRNLGKNPRALLIDRWNWKSALFSSVLRALIFLFANLPAGRRAAFGAMLAEFIYRAVSAGFYGAITQAFRDVEPQWAAGIAVSVAIPIISHGLELTIHLLRGTPKIWTSITASVCFTIISTLFNLYAMRRGALVIGEGAQSMGADMRRVPRLIVGFVCVGPIAVYARLRPAAAAAWRGASDRRARKQY